MVGKYLSIEDEPCSIDSASKEGEEHVCVVGGWLVRDSNQCSPCHIHNEATAMARPDLFGVVGTGEIYVATIAVSRIMQEQQAIRPKIISGFQPVRSTMMSPSH